MIRTRYRLALALAASLMIHLAPFIAEQPPKSAPPPARAAIQAKLAPPRSLPAPTALMLEEVAPPAKPARQVVSAAKSAKSLHSANTWQQEVRQQFQRRQRQGLFYPAEAIEKGQQGEALVLLIVDRNGQVAAARIEQSSGFRILDDAALAAVRALHSLPADAPRETLLPVSFRLK